MLKLAKEIVSIKEVNYMGVYDMFHDLAGHRRDGNGAVVQRQTFIARLVDWNDLAHVSLFRKVSRRQ